MSWKLRNLAEFSKSSEAFMELEELAEPDWLTGNDPEHLPPDGGDSSWVDAYEL